MDLFNADDFSFFTVLRKLHKARIGHFSFSSCLLGLEISSRHRLSVFSTFMFFHFAFTIYQAPNHTQKRFSQKSVNAKHSPCPKAESVGTRNENLIFVCQLKRDPMIYSTTIIFSPFFFLALKSFIDKHYKLIWKFALNEKIILSRGEINGKEIETWLQVCADFPSHCLWGVNRRKRCRVWIFLA